MSPPRSDSTNSRPSFSSCWGEARRFFVTLGRRPQVMTGGCSTRRMRSFAPATTSACTCSWRAHAWRYGMRPRSSTAIGMILIVGRRKALASGTGGWGRSRGTRIPGRVKMKTRWMRIVALLAPLVCCMTARAQSGAFDEGSWSLATYGSYAEGFRLRDDKLATATVSVGYYFTDRFSINAEGVYFSFDEP